MLTLVLRRNTLQYLISAPGGGTIQGYFGVTSLERSQLNTFGEFFSELHNFVADGAEKIDFAVQIAPREIFWTFFLKILVF